MTSNEVLPCPFCGKKPHFYQIPAPTRGKFVWKVMCSAVDCCAILNDYDTLEQVIEAWNNRKGETKHA